jgi:hypothetical protein
VLRSLLLLNTSTSSKPSWTELFTSRDQWSWMLEVGSTSSLQLWQWHAPRAQMAPIAYGSMV